MKNLFFLRYFVVVNLLLALWLGGAPRQNTSADILIVRVAPGGLTTGACGDSWEDACDLQYALTKAASGTEIWVAVGTYMPTTGTDRSATFQLKNGVALYGGFSGSETDHSQRDPAAHVTVFSGQLNPDDGRFGSYRVVTGSGTDETAVIDGFTITGSFDNYDTGGIFDNYGGGMFNNAGSPTVSHVIFSNNFGFEGGAMSNIYGSSPTLTDVSFINNYGTWAGGMYNVSGSSPTLTNVSFTSNNGGFNGGMLNSLGSNPTLTHVTFQNNTGYHGGGLGDDNSSPTLNDVTFTSNAVTGRGGGMFDNTNCSSVLNYVTFSNNTADSGGGLYIQGTSGDVLSDVTFIGNSAASGGGITTWSSDPILSNVTFINNSATVNGGGMYNYHFGDPILINVTFTGNTATYGGGIMDYDAGDPTLDNVTISGNSASSGGGIYNTSLSSPTIKNSIVWENTAEDNTEIYSEDRSNPVVTFSDVQGGFYGLGNINADPLLGSPDYYNGGSLVLPLLPGSAAIDAGDDATCASTDPRGLSRPQGLHCDMGAFESHGFTLAISGGDHQSTGVNTTFALPLTVNVSSAFSEPVDGGIVTFTPPDYGAGALLTGNPAIIIGGKAQVIATANNTPGPYTVSASSTGIANLVGFSLSNDQVFLRYLPIILQPK